MSISINHGLLNATNKVFPSCPERYRLIHIYANFQVANLIGEKLKKNTLIANSQRFIHQLPVHTYAFALCPCNTQNRNAE